MEEKERIVDATLKNVIIDVANGKLKKALGKSFVSIIGDFTQSDMRFLTLDADVSEQKF